MQNEDKEIAKGFIESLCGEYRRHNYIDPAFYETYNVKRGLRNADGTGVMAGVTQIGNVLGYYVQDGERVPMPGKLVYRGIDVEELIDGFMSEGRFGFEETAYLLLMGSLPTRGQLSAFQQLLSDHRSLPRMFTEDMILKAPSPDVMNKLARSVLALYSYDDDPDDMSLPNQLRQAVQLIARVPVIVAHAFAVKRHYYDNESLYLHRPQEGLSVAENFLYSVRHDNRYTDQEAKLLDLCLVLHAEHGGGNNSAFACRVLSSSGTDTYSAIAAAVGSLKGPRHGGANKKVMEMFSHIQENVHDWKDDDEVRAYLGALLRKEAGDRSGLIYGMGHAIYTLSDPRAVILKRFAKKLAATKGMLDEFELYESVERLTPEVLLSVKGEDKVVCANVDLFSGMVYKMMGIPQELYTPLFAVARMVGWCAHRIEEVYQPGNRIIRPAYKAVAPMRTFIPLDQR
ncbi:citrate/2-methylcitrate synthase [Flavonifractor sp. DFI.6.63]|uniref:Citrate synthase n=1 Tax=Lawsonibacter hominis TaxID=2763053 RepID=A0A8J6M927_9FIRM|nr:MULTISPECIES: citrate/2-methylcitrate synthase [Oscillospiraceae]MBC5734301.1 citrate/2-methylcitrate synthase [Lawsonibacter hominis]MCI6398415.1 citrate/2-methylcitrate synthase [Lawsonibacter sp.]MCQ5027976.1 citrate/2-methylcitrate synthase [Flavonifractor sp. DFI.6.63]MDY2976077.1 citrate/2-methylcitrate synthase [Oscillospiraceae bacterium]